MMNGRQTLLKVSVFFFTERMGKISGWFKTGLLLDKMSRACHCLRFIDKLDEMGNCMEYCTKGIVLSIKDYYDMANNDHKPVSPETKSIQPDMCVDGNITMVKNIQPASDYTGVSCMIYDERIMDI